MITKSGMQPRKHDEFLKAPLEKIAANQEGTQSKSKTLERLSGQGFEKGPESTSIEMEGALGNNLGIREGVKGPSLEEDLSWELRNH